MVAADMEKPDLNKETSDNLTLSQLQDSLRSYDLGNRNPPASDWYAAACDKISNASNNHKQKAALNNNQVINAFLTASAAARRKVGRDVLHRDPRYGDWHADEVVRLCLLSQLKQVTPKDTWPEVLFAIYRQGDEAEKTVIVRSLSWLEGEHNLKTIALDAGRANSVDIFSALALRNPYPAEMYDDDTFFHMLLKALFLDLNIALVMGLASRRNSELTQLSIDLVNERLLANRMPPASIWLAMHFDDLNDTDKDIWLAFLHDPNLPQEDALDTTRKLEYQAFCLQGLCNAPPTNLNTECLSQLTSTLEELAKQDSADIRHNTRQLTDLLATTPK